MKTKHTQGEWKIDDSNTKGMQNCYWYGIIDSKKRTLAEVKGIHYDIKNTECDANAKLIASAPELLKALNQMVNTFWQSSYISINKEKTVKQAQDAIKKAIE